ncbi:DUF1549 domain-containing protein [Anatilimnocola sp. NA78]|uniref:DUF1549 domain-containing protein n=1 Tax=Anatilimnocola sp. NA78 TaxID=3415683 RepID=UPI003CE59616
MSRIVGGLLLVAVLCGATLPVDAQTPKTGAVASADYNIPQVKYINEQIRQVWKDNEMTPSPMATDGEWCRRVYLDILGRVPSVTELREFASDKTPDRKLKLVNKLLFDEIYLEDYARNWTTIWTNILIGRTGGTEDRTLTSREGMQKYLRDSFAQDKPYDRMVYELVSATGTTSPGSPKFNGAANYLVMKLDENAAQATAMTAKNFLGLQVQCTQCHNHPFNDWKQQKFWEFNAFFRQTRALRTFVPGTRDVESAELVNQDFAGEGGGGDASEAIIFYELRNGLMASAYPVFVNGKEAPRSGYVSDANRREELAKMIVASEYMDKTIANRIWHHFLGYGFTKPIDDMGPHNTPTHPELLDYLGKEVRTNSFNLKELIKWVALSEAYSLSSKITPGNKADDPLMGETPKFTHFYLRNMRAEELYESLIVATEAQKTKGDYAEQEKLKTQWLSQFNQTFGTDEGDEQTTFNGTIPQQLMMMNGDLVKKAVSTESGSFLHKVATSKLSPAQKIDYLFQAALSRAPTQGEVDIANKLLQARGGDSVAALQDVFWAALNANEFILQH